MKIPPVAESLAVCAVITMASLFTFSEDASAQQKKMPEIPVGWLDAYPTIVHTGTHPTIRWGIDLPSEVLNVIEIQDSSTISATEEISIEVRVLGNGVTAHDHDNSWQYVPTQALISFDGSSYEPVFYGTNNDVQPDAVVWERTGVKRGEKIRFGGRYRWNNSWGPTYRSGDGTKNIRTLVDGDKPPITKPGGGVPTLENFLKPYLDENGRVDIGPMDVIVFMELTHGEHEMEHSGYDMQDLVLICTVKPKSRRNNRSGLADGTNPGQGNQMGNNDGTDNPNQSGN